MNNKKSEFYIATKDLDSNDFELIHTKKVGVEDKETGVKITCFDNRSCGSWTVIRIVAKYNGFARFLLHDKGRLFKFLAGREINFISTFYFKDDFLREKLSKTDDYRNCVVCNSYLRKNYDADERISDLYSISRNFAKFEIEYIFQNIEYFNQLNPFILMEDTREPERAKVISRWHEAHENLIVEIFNILYHKEGKTELYGYYADKVGLFGTTGFGVALDNY